VKELGRANDKQGDLIAIAHVLRTQGNRGEVSAEMLTDFPDRFARLQLVQARCQDGAYRELMLEGYRFHKGRIVLKFEGIDNISAAEELIGCDIVISEQELVELPPDTFFDFDLIDCQVVTTDETVIGKVTGLQRIGGSGLLAVQDGSGRERLIPFAEEICVEIDIKAKLIRIAPPEGLLEL